MTPYHVYILRPASLSDGIVEDAFSIIEHSKGFIDGPLRFHLDSWDYESSASDLEEPGATGDEPRVTSEVCFSVPSRDESLERTNRSFFRLFRQKEVTPPLPIGRREISIDKLLENCKRIATEFRNQKRIGESNNLVIVTTTQGNINNFFAEGADVNTPTALVQINHTVMQEGNPQLLLAYYMAAMPLKAIGFNDPEYITKYAHENTKGCMNDLCAEDVYHLRIKTKTADVCETCKNILRDKNVPYPIIKQVRDIFGLVRKIQINIEDFEQDWSQPRIEISASRLTFPDNGKVLRLSPKEMAIYVLFMNEKDGIHYDEMSDYKSKLETLYGKCYRGEIIELMRYTVDSLCDISDKDNLRETISKCNAKIKNALGRDMSFHFIIKGERGEKKSISSDRALVSYSNIWGF